MPFDPVTLEGNHVRLEPLRLEHVPELFEIGHVEEVWRWFARPLQTRDQMQAFVEEALNWQRAGSAVPFVTVDKQSGRLAGCTRLANIVEEHKRAEIGWTFVAPEWHRTAVNTEAKYLMLRHGFEAWNLNRVEFKTHHRNERSRRAIARIGATEEGIFRNHMIHHDGTMRHTVYFSILREEWPQVKASLEMRLAMGATPAPAR